MSEADNRQRAEFPPALYWRRWCADAPAPVLPRADAPAAGSRSPAPARPVGVPAAPASAAPSAPAAATPPATAPVADPAAPAVDGAQYRVLIVEDDPSQALFAETVLCGAGMHAQVASGGSEVMAAMEQLRPDLVLMDLHMPGLDGGELTSMIRARADFALTPVVFLTGDEDPERRFEALDIGADDYLRKPVRPRHLISAVQNRILRARALQAAADDSQRHPATGLHTRAQMLHLLSSSVATTRGGGVFFIEVTGTAALRDRFGYAALETLLTDAARRLGEVAGELPASRLNDNTFLVFAPDLASDALTPFARRIRDGLGEHAFSIGAERVRLRALAGYASLSLGFEDAGSALSAAEEALRNARTAPHGIAAWERPIPMADRTSAELAQSLRGALASGKGLMTAFQPIVAVAGGDDVQYQVLLRLRDGQGAIHAAGQVLAAAARLGVTAEVDRRVIGIAIDTLKRLRQHSRAPRLFVTQSPSTLAHDGYADWLLQALADAGVDGTSLVVDVRLEDALVHALSLQEFCAAMVAAGVQLCLSQYRFGTEANLLLTQLPLGYVRLAARYSSQLDDIAVRDEMRSAIEHAHRLGLQVIGQQVEDAQSAATLWMTGVDFIQGNLVQRPADELDFDFQTSVL